MIKFRDTERGQALVIVVFAIIGLLVFAGLAIDGGTVFLERRRMQNAADAGSLAGTRELAARMCDDPPDPVGADDAIWKAVKDYAKENGVKDDLHVTATYVKFDGTDVVQFDPPVVVGNGLVPDDAVGVSAVTNIDRRTALLQLIGIETSNTSASATAIAGPPLTAGGMRPFGVPVQVMEQLSLGDCFTSNFKNCKEQDDYAECWIQDDDGDVIGQHRNWMNLNHVWNAGEAFDFPRASGGSAGASDLGNWMANGWNGTLYADCRYWDTGCKSGDFIHAKPGTDSSVIGSTPINEVFLVPIFDKTPEYSQIPDPKADPVPQGGDYYYHVVGFAAIKVLTEDDADQGGGTIHACVDELIWGQGTPSPNEGYGSDVCETTGAWIVSLWK
jgi:hypothetical protein